MKQLFYYTCVLTAFAALSAPAFAVDGVTLINQATVQAAGGFPYVINQPGSYRLSGDLVAQNTTAIKIVVNNVTLDLNGFVVYCTACSGVPGIWSTGGNTSVLNGSVGDFGGGLSTTAYGLYFTGFAAKVDHVTAYANTWGIFATVGLTVTNSVLTYNAIGAECDGTLAISGSTVQFNSTGGVYIGSGTVTGNVIDSNGLNGTFLRAGIMVTSSSGAVTVTNNTITNNMIWGIIANTSASAIVGYGANTFAGNGGDVGSMPTFFSMKNNVSAAGVF